LLLPLGLLAIVCALALGRCGLGSDGGAGGGGGEVARGKGDGGQPPVERFEISFSGDLLMHTPLLYRAQQNGGGGRYEFEPFFSEIKRWVKGPKLAVCHLEIPLGEGEPTGYPLFKAPTDLARSIKRSGWDACSTASNHSLDQGMEGIRSTVRALDRRGVAHTGTFASAAAREEPLLLKAGPIEVGFIAYTDATNGIPLPEDWAVATYPADEPRTGAELVLADARKAREAGADLVIVNLHWGPEYALEPSPEQRKMARLLTRAPEIDAIVGQGPHVVQPIERINGKYVVFSEGNLVSNQSPAAGLPAHSQDGLIALLEVEARGQEARITGVEYVPVWVRPGDYVVLPADPDADPANAQALADSFARTTEVAGKGKGVRIASLSAP
jgi:poly-gamma-glutamate synthesis protein (capsule biosynthesis protein)